MAWSLFPTAEGFQKFLDSLATRGGNILLLLFVNSLFVLLIIFFALKGQAFAAVVATLGQSSANFSGALLLALQGGQSRQRAADGQGNGNGSAPQIQGGK